MLNILGLSWDTCKRILTENVNTRRMAAKSMDRLLNGKINISVPMGLQDEAKNYIKFLSKITTRKETLWIKPTDTLNSSFVDITILHVSVSLSVHRQEFLAAHQHWYILCRVDDRLLSGAGWNSAPRSKRSSKLHKIYQCRCTAKNSWWWAERLPETCRVVIPIKLEFSVSVCIIH